MKKTLRAGLIAGVTGLAIAMTAGCSAEVSIGTDKDTEITKADLQTSVADNLTDELHVQVDGVTCNGGLQLKIDATQVCELSVNGKTSRVDVTATDTEGHFNMHIPTGVSKENLVDYLMSNIRSSAGHAPDEVRCQGVLVIGGTQSCAMRKSDTWLPIEVTGTETAEGTIKPSSEVRNTAIPAPPY